MSRLSLTARFSAAAAASLLALGVVTASAVPAFSKPGGVRTLDPAPSSEVATSAAPVGEATSSELAPVVVDEVTASPVPTAVPSSVSLETAAAQPALLDGVLRIFDFGASVGLPLGCQTVLGVITAGLSDYPEVNAAFGSSLLQIGDACKGFATEASKYLQDMRTQIEAFAAINPVVNPGLDAFAATLRQIGTEQAEAVAPFGPTLVQLAGAADFFKGRP